VDVLPQTEFKCPIAQICVLQPLQPYFSVNISCWRLNEYLYLTQHTLICQIHIKYQCIWFILKFCLIWWIQLYNPAVSHPIVALLWPYTLCLIGFQAVFVTLVESIYIKMDVCVCSSITLECLEQFQPNSVHIWLYTYRKTLFYLLYI
jgi:hypothetical protein